MIRAGRVGLLSIAVAACAAPRRAPPSTGAAGRAEDGSGRAPAANVVVSAAPSEPRGAAQAPAPATANQSAGRPFATVGDVVFDGAAVARECFRGFRRESFAALNRMVVRELVRQEAARSGMAAPSAWLEEARARAFADLAAEALKAYGKGVDAETYLRLEFKESKAQWARRTEEELVDRWLRDRVVRLQAMRSDAVELRIIAVRDEGLAREIAAKLDSGADFAALAIAHSVHETAANGGRMPPVSRESLNPALADRAFALAPGERSGVLSVEDGAGGRQFDVIKVVARRPARPGVWSEAAESIEAGLAAEPVSRFEFVAWQLSAFRLYNVHVDDSL